MEEIPKHRQREFKSHLKHQITGSGVRIPAGTPFIIRLTAVLGGFTHHFKKQIVSLQRRKSCVRLHGDDIKRLLSTGRVANYKTGYRNQKP